MQPDPVADPFADFDETYEQELEFVSRFDASQYEVVLSECRQCDQTDRHVLVRTAVLTRRLAETRLQVTAR
ncbi:MAG: hypothetical protein RLZZ360_283 [Candidatus Parcubacteria bacterium]|jgi:hypothetical protein